MDNFCFELFFIQHCGAAEFHFAGAAEMIERSMDLFDKHDTDEFNRDLAKKTSHPPIRHTDPNINPGEQPRLGGQNGKVLERLEQGPATNVELATYSGSTRINSRVADVRRYLRLSGRTVVATCVDKLTGVYRYEIE